MSRKPLPWIWRSLVFVVAFPGLFYGIYLRHLVFSWKSLVAPLILAGIVAVLGGIFEMLCRVRRVRAARTDWVERIAASVVFVAVVPGFTWCAVIGGYSDVEGAIWFTVGFIIAVVLLQLLRGSYYNDRPGLTDGAKAPLENIPPFPYLLFPSNRAKRQ